MSFADAPERPALPKRVRCGPVNLCTACMSMTMAAIVNSVLSLVLIARNADSERACG